MFVSISVDIHRHRTGSPDILNSIGERQAKKEEEMRTKRKDQKSRKNNYKRGMELVQVALLVSIAIGLALIFRTQITAFVDGIFDNLMSSGF